MSEAYIRNLAGNCAEETHVVFHQQSQVVDPVAHHGDAVDPEAEGESGVTLGVDPTASKTAG